MPTMPQVTFTPHYLTIVASGGVSRDGFPCAALCCDLTVQPDGKAFGAEGTLASEGLRTSTGSPRSPTESLLLMTPYRQQYIKGDTKQCFEGFGILEWSSRKVKLPVSQVGVREGDVASRGYEIYEALIGCADKTPDRASPY